MQCGASKWVFRNAGSKDVRKAEAAAVCLHHACHVGGLTVRHTCPNAAACPATNKHVGQHQTQQGCVLRAPSMDKHACDHASPPLCNNKAWLHRWTCPLSRRLAYAAGGGRRRACCLALHAQACCCAVAARVALPTTAAAQPGPAVRRVTRRRRRCRRRRQSRAPCACPAPCRCRTWPARGWPRTF